MKKLLNVLLVGFALSAFAGCKKDDSKMKEPKKEHMKKDKKPAMKKKSKSSKKYKSSKSKSKAKPAKMKKEDKGY